MKRVCSICKIEKDLEDFYKSKIEKLGREYRCKECSRKKCRKYIENDPEGWRLRSKKWRERKVAENPNFYNERYHRFKKIPEYSRESKEELDKKKKARVTLGNAIKNGKVTKPNQCSKCMKVCKRIEGHHLDYDKPLEVIWYCTPCHVLADRIRSEQEALSQ